MAQIPKLYENPYQTNQDEEATTSAKQPNYARRRRIAGTVVGIAISPLLVKGWIDSSHYGYHQHPAASHSAKN